MVYFHTHLKINEACRILNMFLGEPNMCQYIYYLTISGYLRSFGASPLNLVSRVTVEGHCGGPKLDWGWCFTVEPGFQGHCGGPKLDRACYFGCFVEKSKSVFYVCVYNKINKTHILYRCFAQIQLWNSEIQRVDCIRFV